MDAKQTGRFIAALRKEKGLTQEQLANKIGVTDKAVSRWETGYGFPDVDSMIALSEFFGVSVNEILYGERAIPAREEDETAEEAQKKELAQIACDSLDLSIKKRRFSRAAKILAAALAVVLVLSAVLIVTGRREKPAEPPISETPVVFSDPYVENAIRTELDRAEGEIFPSELKGIASITLSDARINDLSDLEKLPYLTSLALTNVELSDPSPIGRLTSLNYLIAEEVELPDISFLSGLGRLRQLRLIQCGITDISPLAELSGLRSLKLDGNGIKDITPLLGLTGLQSLSVSWNPLSREQADKLRSAHDCTIECSFKDDEFVTLWPLDPEGDGNECVAVDMRKMIAGSAQVVLLDGDGILIDEITEFGLGAEPVSIAVVNDASQGACVLLLYEARGGMIPAYQLYKYANGLLCIAEESEGMETNAKGADEVTERLRGLCESGTLVLSTDPSGLNTWGAYRKDTGEAMEIGNAVGLIGAAKLPPNVKGSLENAGFIVAEAGIGLSFA